jgi:diguanylate cyclase (GGDEF)-like protein
MHLAEREDELEVLLEATWSGRDRRFDARERAVEAGLTTLFLLGAGLLMLALPAGWRPDPLLIVLIVAYSAASMVLYPLGVGDIIPTEPFLVMMFAIAPAPVVPLLVWVGLLLRRLVQGIAGHRHPERLLLAGGDAAHALGPAVLFVGLGYVYAGQTPWPLWIAALFAQLLFDSLSAGVREGLVHRVKPELQLPILAQVAALDGALLPLGLLGAAAIDESRLAPLALLPLIGLLAFTARDRSERTSRLSARFHALERERHRLQVAVKRIGEAFASQLDMDALLEITTRAAADALNADAGRASAVGPGDRGLVRRFTVGEDRAATDLLRRAEASAVAGTGLSTVAAGDAQAMSYALCIDTVPSATIAIARNGTPFTDDERELFEYLCEQATVAAENVSRHEMLHRQALTDELTGLANHRRFQELLAAATERYKRTSAPAALVLLDLDHFKLVNDVHGHQIGDKVLRTVARHLQAACRSADEPARYGGEELAVVLNGADLEKATEFAERVRRGIAGLEVTGVQGERLKVTVSAGVAVLDEDTATSATLIAAADAALYAAKLNGRNRVEAGSHPVDHQRRVDGAVSDLPLAVPRGGQHALAELALTLANALDAKQASMAGHSQTVAHLSALIAEGLGLQPSHVYRIWLAGLVHDVGKIAVADAILNKPEPLTPEEYEAIKVHSVEGEKLLAGTALTEQAEWVRHHHERYDGAGYPDGLAGEQIPIESRIIHVADAFEAMLSDRPYRLGIGQDAAARELIEHVGTQFDPRCVEILLTELEIELEAPEPSGRVAA